MWFEKADSDQPFGTRLPDHFASLEQLASEFDQRIVLGERVDTAVVPRVLMLDLFLRNADRTRVVVGCPMMQASLDLIEDEVDEGKVLFGIKRGQVFESRNMLWIDTDKRSASG